MDYCGRAVWSHFIIYLFLTPSALLVWEKAAKVSCCEAPETFL